MGDSYGLFGLETTVTIGIITGAVFLILCMIVSCWYYLAKKKDLKGANKQVEMHEKEMDKHKLRSTTASPYMKGFQSGYQKGYQ